MKYRLLVGALMITSALSSQQLKTAQITQKVDSLLSLMTLAEKVGQTNMYNGTWEFTGPVPKDGNNQLKADNISNGYVGGMLNVLTADGTREAQKMAVENSRLGIPLIFGYDVIHGYKTMLPVPIGQSSSWDYEGVRQGAALAARETAASGVHWTFSPMIDVSHDARWGRIMEGAGEDPYLSSVMARAWIKGYQGDDLSDPTTIAACAKHFAGYAFAEAGRDYNTADVSRQTLYNVILPPFKAAVEAGAATFMNAFNDVGGVPATADSYLQRDILKGKWGFDGFMVSDWGSIGELLTHGVARDSAHAGLLAFSAGSDMDMEARIYEYYLQGLVEKGAIDEALLDDAVRRILTIKYQLGLFDDPYRYSDTSREKNEVYNDQTKAIARDVARKSMVLLKNQGDLLPLDPNVKSIAVIGQLAGSKDIPLGNWRAQAVPNSAVSLEEGIRNAVSRKTKVTFAQGYTITEGRRDFVHELKWANDTGEGFAEAIEVAKSAEVVVMAVGEDCYQTGEGRSQSDIRLVGRQLELFQEITKVNSNVVVVLMNGRPLAIPELAEQAPAILETWFAGSEAGNATADVLFGKYNPSGKLPVTFPHNVGQEPLHYDRKNTGRPVTNAFDNGLVFWSHYTDVPNEGVFPFGHGLSYASFSYSDLMLKTSRGVVEVSVNVTNTSEITGKETVQVYIRDRVASLAQPIKKLVDFKQLSLKPGESREVTFTLNGEDLGFYDNTNEFIVEDGLFDIMVGTSSESYLKQSTDLTF
ncbi:beta-glucosidase BglX [Marinoscillum sp.]|uniref:beta-glucosidase BglX n=1 Tax=Marinoscillum sp. TaxID=2024838 RepID=UPI003BA9E9BA